MKFDYGLPYLFSIPEIHINKLIEEIKAVICVNPQHCYESKDLYE